MAYPALKRNTLSVVAHGFARLAWEIMEQYGTNPYTCNDLVGFEETRVWDSFRKDFGDNAGDEVHTLMYKHFKELREFMLKTDTFGMNGEALLLDINWDSSPSKREGIKKILMDELASIIFTEACEQEDSPKDVEMRAAILAQDIFTDIDEQVTKMAEDNLKLYLQQQSYIIDLEEQARGKEFTIGQNPCSLCQTMQVTR